MVGDVRMAPRITLAPVAAIVTPCAEQAPVRALLAALAEADGFAYRDETSTPTGRSRRLLVRTDATHLAGVSPTHAAVVVGSPEVSPLISCAQYGLGEREGVVFAAHALGHAYAYAARTGAPVITVAELAADPAQAIPRLAHALGMVLHKARTARLAHDFATALGSLPALPPMEGGPFGFYGPAGPQPGRAGWWGRPLFFSGDAPGQPCPEAIDLTGRARILAYGPYLALPPGRWRLTARLEMVDADAARQPYRLEFGGQAAQGATDFRPVGGAGLYDVAVDAVLADVESVELRVWLVRSAFHGTVRFIGASLEWLTDAPPIGSAA